MDKDKVYACIDYQLEIGNQKLKEMELEKEIANSKITHAKILLIGIMLGAIFCAIIYSLQVL